MGDGVLGVCHCVGSGTVFMRQFSSGVAPTFQLPFKWPRIRSGARRSRQSLMSFAK